MINLQKLYKRPQVFQRLTGLTPNKFQQLLIRLEPIFKESELKRKKTTNRQRKVGGGRKQSLSFCQTPIKKKKNKQLTKDQKSFNKQFNKTRIGVEHVFAHLKKFNILNHKFRNPISSYNLIFKNIAGIRNFQIA